MRKLLKRLLGFFCCSNVDKDDMHLSRYTQYELWKISLIIFFFRLKMVSIYIFIYTLNVADNATYVIGLVAVGVDIHTYQNYTRSSFGWMSGSKFELSRWSILLRKTPLSFWRNKIRVCIGIYYFRCCRHLR